MLVVSILGNSAYSLKTAQEKCVAEDVHKYTCL